MKKRKKPGPKPGFWVKFYYDECVLCGRSYHSREFIYDRPKPKEHWKRYEYSEHLCGNHYL
jgi:hypothetical protein